MADKKYIPVALRRLVRERADGRCEYCRCHDGFSAETFEVEHVIPRANGGLTVLRNLAYACSGCNGRKATRTEAVDPITGELASLFHPRVNQWADHFIWSSGYTKVDGTTATGRATVAALHLNRQAVVNLRRVLVLAGEHPPSI
ncbi:MAG: HNH endonuclease [Caldilineaceae bacterium]|nr:HNH endonuclease [Caldilineaceae bacterium]MCB0124510.1 HNH endonuclease [Caldilineaceae bacterium]